MHPLIGTRVESLPHRVLTDCKRPDWDHRMGGIPGTIVGVVNGKVVIRWDPHDRDESGFFTPDLTNSYRVVALPQDESPDAWVDDLVLK